MSMIRPHSNNLAILFRVIDALVIVGSLIGISLILDLPLDYRVMNAGLLSIVVFWLVAESNQLYRSWRSIRFIHQAGTTFMVWMVSGVLVTSVAFFLKASDVFPRRITLLWGVAALVLLLLWRFSYRRVLYYFRSRNYNTRTALIIGATSSAEALANEFKYNPRHGVRLIGFFDDRNPNRLDPNVVTHGRVDDAVRLAKESKVDNVYIALPLHAEQRTQEFLEKFADTTANVYLIPNFFIYNLLYSRWREIGNVLTLSVYDSPHLSVDGWLKRIEDLVLSFILILLLAVPMLFIALAVKLSSPGPVIFKQYRYGLDGKKIQVFKFRSMTVTDNGPVVKQATRNDARITPLGAFLRRTSLDELPQIFNVFLGSMSLVGPRPHAVAHNEEYRKLIKGYMLRHKVKPGITGWAQINGYRGETDTLEKMEGRIKFDLEYIHRWSIWFDFKILFLTLYKTRQIAANAY